MTKAEKESYLKAARRHYGELDGKKAKGAFLDQFCETTGMCRKNAIRRLSPRERPRVKRGRPFKAGMPERDLLVRIWKLAGMPCGRLLKPVIVFWIRSLRRAGESISPEFEAALAGISASTIDRRLRGAKPRCGGGRRAASLAEHRREIPLKVDRWPADAAAHPGWVEVDSVAHCGGSMSGSFCWSQTMTDVATQWTEMRVTWNNGSEAVVGRLCDMRGAVPFRIVGVNTDNGPEYLNWHVRRNFALIFPDALRTRSRPYVKNDNAHVEQKNGHRVRRLFGFGRFDVQEAVEAMNEVARLQSLYDNLFRPTLKLQSKTQAGHKYRKKFEREAKTPAQRVLDNPGTSEECKRRVRSLLEDNDPMTLLRRIWAAKDRMRRIMSGKRAKTRAPAHGGGGSVLRTAPAGTPRAPIGGRTEGAPGAAGGSRWKENRSVTPVLTQPKEESSAFR